MYPPAPHCGIVSPSSHGASDGTAGAGAGAGVGGDGGGGGGGGCGGGDGREREGEGGDGGGVFNQVGSTSPLTLGFNQIQADQQPLHESLGQLNLVLEQGANQTK